MKQHKVIAIIKNNIAVSEFTSSIEEVATYERVYRSKSAALNDMRQMVKEPIMPAQSFNGYSKSAKFFLSAHVVDVETGSKFNHFDRGCVDFKHYMNPDEAAEANCDKLVEALEARGFSKVS